MEHTQSSKYDFHPGENVIYGVHGKCAITSIEHKQVGNETVAFYVLQPVKAAIVKSKKQEPAIWLPVTSARKRGLRAPVSSKDVESVMAILGNREYYFSLDAPWAETHAVLEKLLTEEGAIGLAKAQSYLYVLKKRQIVLPSEIGRYAEMVSRVLTREIADAFAEPIRSAEERMEKALRHKLSPDN